LTRCFPSPRKTNKHQTVQVPMNCFYRTEILKRMSLRWYNSRIPLILM
jgi:hypothetical protein